MDAKRATVTFAVSAALALAGQPALAQRGRGGGHPGGGGRPGVSHAVPRGAPHYGGAPQFRHPRAGTGYSHGHYRGHYGRHYPYNGGRYGYYYPYGHSSFYFGAYIGWPYYSWGWWPYGGAGYGYYPAYSVHYHRHGEEAPEPPPSRDGEQGDRSAAACAALRGDLRAHATGRVRLEVRPEDASVYVDDEFCGNAREARFLTLPPGRHAIELVRPGFAIARREADVAARGTVDVLVELQRP